ncbi:MAG: hypothetical protein R3359_02845 [Marinirhabdus sp.]|nr:hypothetical protein [Marinirhabdus sp.]
MNVKIFLFVFLFFSSICSGQVIINGTTASASSALALNSSDKGVLIPKVYLPSVTTSQLDGTNSAADGLLIYNTNASVTGGDGVGYYMYSTAAGRWERVLTPKANVGVLPIGSIIAWFDRIDFPALTLPEGWQLCDGSIISDADSPLNGLATPDINSNTTSASGVTSYGRFLRGSTTSGIFEQDQTNSLEQITTSSSISGLSDIILDDDGTIQRLRTDALSSPFGGTDGYSFNYIGRESRVVHMTVKYIMRIK